MTTVYVPRVIRTVEDAEALPFGTVAHRVLKVELSTGTFTQPEVAVKIHTNVWGSTAVEKGAWNWLDVDLIGWTALVPVEAIYHTRPMPDGGVAQWYETVWHPYHR